MKLGNLSPEAQALKKKLDELNQLFRADRMEKTHEDMSHMLEYDWVQEYYGGLLERSKFVKGQDGLLSEQPKTPVNLMIAVMRDIVKQPEVMEAYGSAPVKGTIPPVKAHLLRWHSEYMRHKYGNKADGFGYLHLALRQLANGEYSSVDDPSLKKYLLKSSMITDDGKSYD